MKLSTRERMKFASNRMDSRNNDELSAWSCVSMTWAALPAKTAIL